MPQQWFGQQRAALPNKLRRYARMHTCNPWPVLEHMAQTHASRLTIFICWASSSAKVPSRVDNSLSAKARIFLILALPTRESPWSKASRRPPSQEWRTRRKELFRLGAQKATSSDCKTVFSSQTTQRQCYSWSLEGCLDFMSPANQTKSKEENVATNLTKVVWVDARLVASAAMMTRSAPASQLIVKEHVHHTSWTFLLSARIKDPIWSHSNETDLHLRF